MVNSVEAYWFGARWLKATAWLLAVFLASTKRRRRLFAAEELRSLFQESLSTTFHLYWIELFLPRQEHPDMAKEVAHAGGTGAVEQICRWLNFFRTGLDGATQQSNIVVRKDVEAGSTSPKRARFAVQPVVGIADHDD